MNDLERMAINAKRELLECDVAALLRDFTKETGFEVKIFCALKESLSYNPDKAPRRYYQSRATVIVPRD